mmetsp:Transcript_27471/g.69273  ORF Transcript_27471/g.69273 Transcript_27471/m.69273 type:complete len:224 (+) Transcript_27471:3738-4409(+)
MSMSLLVPRAKSGVSCTSGFGASSTRSGCVPCSPTLLSACAPGPGADEGQPRSVGWTFFILTRSIVPTRQPSRTSRAALCASILPILDILLHPTNTPEPHCRSLPVWPYICSEENSFGAPTPDGCTSSREMPRFAFSFATVHALPGAGAPPLCWGAVLLPAAAAPAPLGDENCSACSCNCPKELLRGFVPRRCGGSKEPVGPVPGDLPGDALARVVGDSVSPL